MKNVKKLSNKEPTKDISRDDLKSKIPFFKYSFPLNKTLLVDTKEW